MNVLEARIVLRDRTLLDVVDLALRFVVREWRAYLTLGAIVLLPVFLVTWAVAVSVGWGWAWCAAIAILPFVAAPFTALASRLLFEPTASPRAILGATASALPQLLGARLLQAIGLAAGGACFIVPTVAAWVFFFYANEVLVLERATVGASLARMNRLLSGQSGEAIMAILFLTALHIVAVFLGDTVGRSVLEDLLELKAPASILVAKGSVLALLSFWAFVPFGATCRFLVYINVRTRTEGWDVQTRFAAIAALAAGDDERDEGALPTPERAA